MAPGSEVKKGVLRREGFKMLQGSRREEKWQPGKQGWGPPKPCPPALSIPFLCPWLGNRD